MSYVPAFVGLLTVATIGLAAGGAKLLRPIAVRAIDAISLTGLNISESDPDKLGWLDDAPLTDADRTRIAVIAGLGHGNNLSVIRGIQAGSRSTITRRDFELLRQDRRRAKAAYPDVADDDLYAGVWLQVDAASRIPASFCTSGNSDSTEVDGKFYLDGGCHVSTVRSKYTDRADAPTTRRVLAEAKDARTRKDEARIAKWGYYTWSSGTDGSVSVNGYPDPLPSNEETDDRHVPGQVVIIIDSKMRYQFAFVPSDWVNPPWRKADLIKLAENHGATATDYVSPASEPWIMKDGLLAHGETCPDGRLCWSRWNGDGYDNNDIGPADPESWVIEQPFGLAYLPASDNGERRSDPQKPWFLVITYYGMPPQISGGWSEKEAKEALPRFKTGHSWGMAGQDQEELNRGNLKEARATQAPPSTGIVLADRALPVQPAKAPDRNFVPYSPGMILMPGQSTRF